MIPRSRTFLERWWRLTFFWNLSVIWGVAERVTPRYVFLAVIYICVICALTVDFMSRLITIHYTIVVSATTVSQDAWIVLRLSGSPGKIFGTTSYNPVIVTIYNLVSRTVTPIFSVFSFFPELCEQCMPASCSAYRSPERLGFQRRIARADVCSFC